MVLTEGRFVERRLSGRKSGVLQSYTYYDRPRPNPAHPYPTHPPIIHPSTHVSPSLSHAIADGREMGADGKKSTGQITWERNQKASHEGMMDGKRTPWFPSTSVCVLSCSLTSRTAYRHRHRRRSTHSLAHIRDSIARTLLIYIHTHTTRSYSFNQLAESRYSGTHGETLGGRERSMTS